MGKLLPITVGSAICWFAVLILLLIYASGAFEFKVLLPIGFLFFLGIFFWIDDDLHKKTQLREKPSVHERIFYEKNRNEALGRAEVQKYIIAAIALGFLLLTIIVYAPKIPFN
ncbi:MAG: hypothetical protein PHD95_00795 [Candidatus ainarchaeum sp.]|nr:hypothetical protein [Candidatus ainarchaeum sp.]